MINLFLSRTKSTFHVIICMLFVIPSCVFSANELHDRCSQPFNCGNQNGLRYPFWTSGREDCGHPDFKVDCSGEFAEVSITSVKYRILEANYDSGIIRLARSDFIGDLCPKDPLNATFNEIVLPLAHNTKLLTIYHNCSRAFPQYVSTFVGDLPCGDGDGDDDDTISYYVTTNLSSPLLDGIRGQLDDFRSSCKSVSIPASGPWLETLQRNRTPDNLQKALAEGFQVGLNQDCSSCSASEGACGFNQNSGGFVCYSLEGANNHHRTVDVGLSSGTIAGLAAGVILFLFLDLEMRGSGSLMENGVSSEEEEMVRKMTLVGLWCIQSSPSDRPLMNRVVEMMEGSVDALEVPPRPVFQIPAEPLLESSTISENIYQVTHNWFPLLRWEPSRKLRSFIAQASLQQKHNVFNHLKPSVRDATLPPEIFELSQMYKNLTVFHHCNSKLPYRSSYTCPVIVPKSFVPEEKELNMTNLESVLSKGFEVKVKIDEKACQECSSNHGTHQPSADELYRRCSAPFSCGDQSGLLYPFWIPDREECGHPEFKLDCHSSVAEINICSVKYRILAADYTSRDIRLARSDYIGGLCPQHPINDPFTQNVFGLAGDAGMISIYHECTPEFLQSVSPYVGDLDCEVNEKSYYVTRNLSSPLKDLGGTCKRNVSIPASGPALNTLLKNASRDNLKKALKEGFKVEFHRECSMCMDSGGACGYKKGSNNFLCYCKDHIHSHTCGNKDAGISSPAKADLEMGDSGRPKGNGINFQEEEIAKKMTLVGLWCIQSSPSDRPSMDRVVEMMEGSLDALDVPPKPVLQVPLLESSTLSEDISVYTEVCSVNTV
ncbi:hypothetical protein HID58_072633 [Brassica napus]|uniref:non-specific serine/threonine protein kinase n=1 Tax=Brassica napus TaxID=3708 RepID=A0ABQ7Z548_BRANA|nr:hypothetical protein HID58_072633 [Brassica napus]